MHLEDGVDKARGIARAVGASGTPGCPRADMKSLRSRVAGYVL